MNVSIISITPDAEKTMAHIARVSNPNNQDNPKYAGLLKYCIKHNHWSVFEQSSMTLEIETTRAIAAQILRHRSFTFHFTFNTKNNVFGATSKIISHTHLWFSI